MRKRHAFGGRIARSKLRVPVLKPDAHRRELQALSRQLIKAQETARIHLSRELHDDIGQRLTELSLLLEHINTKSSSPALRKEMAQARKIVVELMQRIRQVARNLRPDLLNDLGLLVALQTHIREFHLRTSISVGFTWETFVESRIPPAIKLVTFRVVQEALTNVARHAHVPHVVLAIRIDESQLRITLCDLGRGFDPLQARNQPGIGLMWMRERVLGVRGAILVESVLGGGTRIVVRLPLGEKRKVAG